MTKIIFLAFAVVFFMISSSWGGHMVLPPPATGSYVTTFASLPDCRLVAFDGFRIFIEIESDWVEIGRLPDKFLGGTDPAFIMVTPDGQDLLLGGGFGGLGGFSDPMLRGTLFQLPVTGGEARLITRIPFHVQAAFRSREKIFLTVGSASYLEGSVQLFEHFDRPDRWTRRESPQRVVQNIPGAPGGVVLDKEGNLYVGLGFAADPQRTGEIRKFRWREVEWAIRKEKPIEFDNGTLVTRILNAGQLISIHKREKELLVGGGDLFGATGSFGFFARVDANTGELIKMYDPTDGVPENHDFLYFALAFCPKQWLASAVDLNTFFFGTPPIVYTLNINESNPSMENSVHNAHELRIAYEKRSLFQVVPNPFQESTVFNYELPSNSSVNLSVYDVTGRLVETLVENVQGSGHYTVEWDVTNMPEGIYFSRLKSGDSVKTKKLLIIH
jgi:hypothetical protein